MDKPTVDGALWHARDTATFSQFQAAEGYLWGYHDDQGWSVVAIYDPESDYVSWWAYSIQTDSLFCTDVEGWPDGLQPPPIIAAKLDGFHLIVGAVQTLLNYVDFIGTMKGTTHADAIPLMAKAYDPDIVIVFRSLYTTNGQQDCPSAEQWRDPEGYYHSLRPFGRVGLTISRFRTNAERRAIGSRPSSPSRCWN